jgi:hypothetical protein
VGTLLVTIKHDVPVIECHRENAIRATIEGLRRQVCRLCHQHLVG